MVLKGSLDVLKLRVGDKDVLELESSDGLVLDTDHELLQELSLLDLAHEQLSCLVYSQVLKVSLR